MTEFSLSLRNIFMRCIDGGGVVWRSEHTFQVSDSVLPYGCQVSSSGRQAQRKVPFHTGHLAGPSFSVRLNSIRVCVRARAHVLRHVEARG